MQNAGRKRKTGNPDTSNFIDHAGAAKRQGFRERSRFTVRRERREHCQMQGFLAGVRKYKQLMRDNGYTFDIKFDGTTERKLSFFGEDGCELDLHELRVTVAEIDSLVESTAYDEFKELWHAAVETQKDWLFYTSEKGRDLHFAKGWYESMTEIDNNMQRLHTALEAAEKEAASSLPF